MILQRTLDTYVGMYDFASTGGAIGSYDLQIPIPKNSCFVEFAAITTIPPTEALIGATISFDLIRTDVNRVTPIIGILLPATPIASFVPLGIIFGLFPGQTGPGFIPFKSPFSFSIGMSIAADALTAGQIQVYMRCISFDF